MAWSGPKVKMTKAQAQEQLVATLELFVLMARPKAGSAGDAPIEATVGIAMAAAHRCLEITYASGMSPEDAADCRVIVERWVSEKKAAQREGERS